MLKSEAQKLNLGSENIEKEDMARVVKTLDTDFPNSLGREISEVSRVTTSLI